jgi:hypothetical protein
MVMVVPMVVVTMPGSERGTGENDEKQRSNDQLLHGSNLARAKGGRAGRTPHCAPEN